MIPFKINEKLAKFRVKPLNKDQDLVGLIASTSDMLVEYLCISFKEHFLPYSLKVYVNYLSCFENF